MVPPISSILSLRGQPLLLEIAIHIRVTTPITCLNSPSLSKVLRNNKEWMGEKKTPPLLITLIFVLSSLVTSLITDIFRFKVPIPSGSKRYVDISSERCSLKSVPFS